MKKLSSQEREKIAAAVAEVEKSTGGEIVTAIIPESSDYAFHELLFGVAAGFLTFWGLTSFATPLAAFFETRVWGWSPWMLPFFLGTAGMLTGAGVYFLAQIPEIDRLVVPRRVRIEAVRRRGMRHFVESGVYDTLDRTGILLFISLLEHRVELIADKGINEKVPPDTWDRIVSTLVRGIKEDRTAQALVEAVRACGVVLQEHVPRRQNDENELKDDITELEKGS